MAVERRYLTENLYPKYEGMYYVTDTRGNKSVCSFEPDKETSLIFWKKHIESWIDEFGWAEVRNFVVIKQGETDVLKTLDNWK